MVTKESFQKAIRGRMRTDAGKIEEFELREILVIDSDMYAAELPKLASVFLREYGFPITELAAYVVWIWHSQDSDANWLSLGTDADNLRVFEEFVTKFGG